MTLLNTTRRRILRLRTDRAMECEGLACEIPPINSVAKLQQRRYDIRHQWAPLTLKFPLSYQVMKKARKRAYI